MLAFSWVLSASGEMALRPEHIAADHFTCLYIMPSVVKKGLRGGGRGGRREEEEKEEWYVGSGIVATPCPCEAGVSK